MNEVKDWAVSETATQTGNILEQLSKGAMVTFTLNNYGISIQGSPQGHYGVLYLKQTLQDIFVLQEYYYDPSLQMAKAIISPQKYPDYYWSAVSDADGLTNALVLQQYQDTVIFTLAPGNPYEVNIQRPVAPPPPFVQTQPDGKGSAYLAYGFESSLLCQFNVNIVG